MGLRHRCGTRCSRWLKNACQAMVDGGVLSIRVRASDLEAVDAVGADPGTAGRNTESATFRSVVLEVADTGPGMDEAVAARAFESFFSTRERRLGLGLAIAHGVIVEHGGSVGIDTESGRGTRVYLALPLTTTQHAAVDSPSLRGRTVLVGEDNPQVREVVTAILQAEGYDVLPAATGDDTLELYAEHSDRIRLLVLDYELPGIDGLECLRRVRLSAPSIPAVLISGFELPQTSQSDSHGVRFLQKPFAVADLAEAVADLLEMDRESR